MGMICLIYNGQLLDIPAGATGHMHIRGYFPFHPAPIRQTSQGPFWAWRFAICGMCPFSVFRVAYTICLQDSLVGCMPFRVRLASFGFEMDGRESSGLGVLLVTTSESTLCSSLLRRDQPLNPVISQFRRQDDPSLLLLGPVPTENHPTLTSSCRRTVDPSRLPIPRYILPLGGPPSSRKRR